MGLITADVSRSKVLPGEDTRNTCGRTCLLHQQQIIVGSIPRPGTGKEPIYVTSRGTIIKRKKHYNVVRKETFGIHSDFRQERQKTAFDLLRAHRPTGVAIPKGECACCYELPHIDGEMICPRSSPYLEEGNRRYGGRVAKSREEAVCFLRGASASIAALHCLGILHGDPGYQNFLLTCEGVIAIDLDDAVYVGAGREDWEFLRFLYYTILPILSEFDNRSHVLQFCREQGLTVGRVVRATAGRALLKLEALLVAWTLSDAVICPVPIRASDMGGLGFRGPLRQRHL
jgi:hypothetical protein